MYGRSLAFLERALLPHSCVLCGCAGERARDLCGVCAGDLKPPEAPCPLCAAPVPTRHAGLPCPRCVRRPPAFGRLHARCTFTDPADQLVHEAKFAQRTACLRVMAELMAEAPHPALASGAVLVPVPLHRTRLRARGFDQARVLAAHLARLTRAPLAAAALSRTRATAPQTGLSAHRRRRNLAGAFAARRPLADPVLLVDDVATTGATLTAAARCCRTAGAPRVDAWVFARTPPRN